MSSAILPHTLAAFAVGSTLVQPATHTTARRTTYGRNGTQRSPATSIKRSRVCTTWPKIFRGITDLRNIFGVCRSMETPRIIRVGTRNYTVRIDAVSQKDVLGCMTQRNTAGK